MERRALVAVLSVAPCAWLGCAAGGDARQTSGVGEAESTAGDPTADTIDPTMFGTSLADESSTADSSDGPGSDTSATDPTSTTTQTTGEGDAPTVENVSPDGVRGVARDDAIAVTFSIEMDPDTITADDGSCSGTVALSRDDFSTCEPLGVAAAGDGLSFTFQPSEPLASAEPWRVRVSTAARSVGGVALDAEFVSDGFVSRYWHTIAIDGLDDWAPSETFSTSTDGHSARVAWDDDYVYVGMRSPDVAGGQSAVWFVVYFGGPGGASDGVLYNTQQPSLPFDARYHLRWRANNDYTDVLEFDGDAWSPGGWVIEAGDVFAQGDLVEMRVARSSLGDPDELSLHLGLLREAMLDEATWAACPGGSYVDGYDPDFAEYWSFDLLGSTLPADHAAQQ